MDSSTIVHRVSSTGALPQPSSAVLRGRDLLALRGETIVRHSPAKVENPGFVISNRGRGIRQVLLAGPEETV